MSFRKWMGMSSGNSAERRKSMLELEQLKQPLVPESFTDRFFGLTNYGNTCYVSSVLVSLYHIKPFRDSLNAFPMPSVPPNCKSVCVKSNGSESSGSNSWYSSSRKKNGDLKKQPSPVNFNGCGCVDISMAGADVGSKHQIQVNNTSYANYGMEENVYTSLKDLYACVSSCECRYGVCSPERFIQILRRDNESFRSTRQQDAHEFLNFLLNSITEVLDEYYRNHPEVPHSKWIHSLFEGTLTSETKCLTCENITSRDESFLDLSIDIEEYSSVTSCLRSFSASEMLCAKNKFHCDVCKNLQEAEKRMKIKKLPKILALHLKRFKYNESQEVHDKLFHTVVFTNEMRLFNTTDDNEDAEKLYSLSAIIVHVGGGSHHGHYVSIVRTRSSGWVLFDDEKVTPVNESYLQRFFGDQPGQATAYVLFFTAAEEFEDYQDTTNDETLPYPISIPNQASSESTDMNNTPATPKSVSTLAHGDLDPMVTSYSSQYSQKADRDFHFPFSPDLSSSMESERNHPKSAEASPKFLKRESKSLFPSLSRSKSHKVLFSSQNNSPKDTTTRDNKHFIEHDVKHPFPFQLSKTKMKR
ncbi:ubiquitin carboxy terminal hydrolase Ubp9 [Schizosaccharomyces cryophilus OY26]|uniref:ubiquitinyl hydrolase 1 n=1 Tax=Schizosaccharomyces cryophilus (strain OY26 / ATCC MYA-4695 / CBS 11777 / NBRC 106824 / NRRL Y48691) TaxID=653667 RepID=S9XJM9_SCHCR|nr:ubiquitin carboxy terminal hydrolase Ubp9 [Schizosaccharomyces cryophilus OY26]EPY53911.1 ubiquitin carboxy terminal hydrolase Ubp9 [Schizosaccharomyces cryophilus OY26]